MSGRITRIICFVTGSLLLAFGLQKLHYSTSDFGLLDQPDEILGTSLRRVLFLAGCGEVIVGGFCLLRRTKAIAPYLIAWLATNYAIYRIARQIWTDPEATPCPCSLDMITIYGMTPQSANQLMTVVLYYLLIVGYGLLVVRAFSAKTQPVSS